MMAKNRNPYRVGLILIEKYGASVREQVGERLLARLSEGDHRRAAFWRLVMAAIIDIESERPVEGQAVH